MLLFAQIQLHDHPSVFGIAKLFIAITAEFSVRLCHKSFSAPLVFCGGSCKDYTTFATKAV